MKFPAKLGACIDLAYKTQQKYLAKKREADAIAAEVAEIENHILATFPKQGLDGGKGGIASATITRSIEPTVKDWPKVFTYVREHDAWDLLFKRVNSKAYRDRLEVEGDLPGIEQFDRIKLSIRKIGE